MTAAAPSPEGPGALAVPAAAGSGLPGAELSGGAPAPAAPWDVLVCRGGSCGRKKTKAATAEAQVEQLRAACREDGAGDARLVVTGCLDRCKTAGVVVLRPPREARRLGARPLWFGGVRKAPAVRALAGWISQGGPAAAPVPAGLRPLRLPLAKKGNDAASEQRTRQGDKPDVAAAPERKQERDKHKHKGKGKGRKDKAEKHRGKPDKHGRKPKHDERGGKQDKPGQKHGHDKGRHAEHRHERDKHKHKLEEHRHGGSREHDRRRWWRRRQGRQAQSGPNPSCCGHD